MATIPTSFLPELRGDLAAGAGLIRCRMDYAGRVISVQAYCEAAGGGISQFDLNINGATVFPTTKPTLQIGQTTGASVNADAGAYTFAAGDLITIDCDSTSLSNPPENVTLRVRLEWDAVTNTPDAHNHAASEVTSGQVALARGGTNADLSATGGSGQYLQQSSVGGNVSVGVMAAGDLPTAIDAAKLADGSVSNTEFQYLNGVTSAIQTQLNTKGTVSSVALSLPAEFSVSGSPITGSGTLTASKANQSANLVYAGPTTGGAAAPAFRALVAADLPAHDHNVSELAAGTLDDGLNIGLGTTTGTKIGTGTNQKLGFYNVTPVTQPTALTAANASTVDTTYGTEEADVINNLRTRLNELETKLQALGFLA